MLSKLSARLIQGKDNNKHLPFAGVNLIFLGDFVQYGPVVGGSLCEPLEVGEATGQYTWSSGKKKDKPSIFAIIGRSLWIDSVKQTKILYQQMRQNDIPYLSILTDLRNGDFRQVRSHMVLLRTRLLGSKTAATTAVMKNFIHAPILVTRNLLRSMINFSLINVYASAMGVRPVVVRSIDHRCKDPTPFGLSDKLKLWHLLDNDTKSLIGMMPYIPKMPLLIKQNIATELGIYNGARCTFVRMVLHPDEPVFNEKTTPGSTPQHWLQRMPLYIVVKITIPPNTEWKFEKFPGFAPGEWPIFPVTESIPADKSKKSERGSFRRHQFPLLPGYAMTGYAAQGQTFADGAVVDLSTPPSKKKNTGDCADSYVLLSRIKSLEGLLILRQFQDKEVFTPQNPWVIQEMHRLTNLGSHNTQSRPSSLSRASADFLAKKSAPSSGFYFPLFHYQIIFNI
jgi:hypothetical protein